MAANVPSGAVTLHTPVRPVPFVPSRELYSGRPALAVQGEATDAGIISIAGLARSSALGAVVTVASNARADTRRVQRYLDVFRDRAGDVSDVLTDANRYFGSGRLIGPTTLDVAWTDAQLNNGQRYALTDSPYIPAGDRTAFESVLTQTADMKRPVVAHLPIANEWLKKDATYMRETINRVGVPVALTVEHAKDPMGVHGVVRGLVHVLGADQPVLLHRCDVSTVVAVAYGAAGGAIGTTTGLRHLYPLPKPEPDGKKRGFRKPRVALLVPRLLAYMSVEKIADLAGHPDAAQYLQCDCDLCLGQTLDRVVTQELAYEHSLRALMDFATTKLAPEKTPALQQLAFNEAGKYAQFAHFDLEAITGVPMEPPAFIGAWNTVYQS